MLTRCKLSIAWLWGAVRMLVRPTRRAPGQAILWALFAITPFLCFFEVEILSENNPFTKLEPWQWVMNLAWYYCLLFIGFLITGRRKGAIAFDAIFSFAIGLGQDGTGGAMAVENGSNLLIFCFQITCHDRTDGQCSA